MKTLATGVLGIGKMGRHHLRCLARAEGLDLVAASDVEASRGDDVPEGVFFTTDPDELVDRCEAVVLAVPTDRHEDLGRAILSAGRHLLVEKPLAPTIAACDRLGEAAESAGTVLAVGHVERMNGAWATLGERIGSPRFIEGHRLAGFDPRGTEVDVVLDLMIHDLDLVLDLFGVDPARVEAVGVAVLTDRVDIANARLEFPGGALVNLTASRVSKDPVRKLRVFEPDRYLSLDLAEQRTEIYEKRPAAGPFGVARDVVTAPEDHNPLVVQLEEFAAAVRGEPSRIASWREGRRAVDLAERILRAIEVRLEAWDAVGEGTPWIDAPSCS